MNEQSETEKPFHVVWVIIWMFVVGYIKRVATSHGYDNAFRWCLIGAIFIYLCVRWAKGLRDGKWYYVLLAGILVQLFLQFGTS